MEEITFFGEEIKPSIFSLDLSKSFKTHYNYVDYLRKLFDGLTVVSKFKLNKRPFDIGELDKKLKLINCFKKSLDDEYDSVCDCSDFAVFNNTWISTKSYYLLFHMWLVVQTLVSSDIRDLKAAHTKINDFILTSIKNKNIAFSSSELNEVHSFRTAESFKSSSGGNLYEHYDDNEIRGLLLKKLANYKLEDFKRINKFKDFRTKKARLERDEYKSKEKISLFDFFYMYRVKTDYKDVDFLDEVDSSDLHKRFYENYYCLTMNLYDSLKLLINELANQRLGRELISD